MNYNICGLHREVVVVEAHFFLSHVFVVFYEASFLNIEKIIQTLQVNGYFH